MTKPKAAVKPKQPTPRKIEDSKPLTIDPPFDDGIKTPAPDTRPPEQRGA